MLQAHDARSLLHLGAAGVGRTVYTMQQCLLNNQRKTTQKNSRS